jgi:antirestriction protein ArdC
MTVTVRHSSIDLWAEFPDNKYVQRLLKHCRTMNIKLAGSPVREQWFYHPEQRTIYVWPPDLTYQSLSYLVVILAHELGHAMDFDSHPGHVAVIRNRHWSRTPLFIEQAAFVNGFCLLKQLQIPCSLDQYAAMIEPPMAERVVNEIENNHLCCLLSSPRRALSTPS